MNVRFLCRLFLRCLRRFFPPHGLRKLCFFLQQKLQVPAELRGEFPKVEFVYGVEPAIDFEIFPFRTVAIVIGIQSPLTLSSSLPTDLWHLSGSLGVRINL